MKVSLFYTGGKHQHTTGSLVMLCHDALCQCKCVCLVQCWLFVHIIMNISFMSGLASEEVSVSVKCWCVQKWQVKWILWSMLQRSGHVDVWSICRIDQRS